MNTRDRKSPTRCAIYTRKSHEEGLEQEFNSLDAQRESAEAYIKSQQHEGWALIDSHYDDGGFSGGNMKRPALTQLLEDIRYNKIDIVMVYKVDRLSRSLSDFSRLIELFDEHNVSFVSVTQQFNTSNSMGRLTLNMLLSFAQFEREVTGERIRDKIEASKKKGLWMGGNPPMGYAVDDRKLVMLKDEVAFVKRCFEGYLNTPSLLTLARIFDEEGFRTKSWTSQKGKVLGNKKLSPNYIYRIINNPAYLGQISHKGTLYDGQHDAIIDKTLWDSVQTRIEQKPKQSDAKTETPYMLKGKFRHYEGYAMSPSSSQKRHKDNSIKTTRYYVSQKAIKQGYKKCEVKSINAHQIESIVISMLVYLLTDERSDLSKAFHSQAESEQMAIFKNLLIKIVISPSKISIEISKDLLNETKAELAKSHDGVDNNTANNQANHPTLIYQPQVSQSATSLIATVEVEIKKVDGIRYILSPNGLDLYQETNIEPRDQILNAFRDAYQWKAILDKNQGRNAKQVAEENNINYTMMLRKLTLTTLAPDIQKLALTGELSDRVSFKRLLEASRELSWLAQHKHLCI